jgi:hypothetical protein
MENRCTALDTRLKGEAHIPAQGGMDRLSDSKVGDSGGPKVSKKISAARRPIKPRGKRGADVGRALRSVYDETLREEVPDDFLDLLGKLN